MMENLLKLAIKIFFVIIFLESCKHSVTENNFALFPLELNLKGTPIELNEVFIGCIMYTHDSLLILTSIRGSENQILIYDLNTFKFYAATGKIGRGPGEISSVSYAIMDRNNGDILYQDMAKHLILRFEVDSILNSASYYPKISTPIPEEKFLIYFDKYSDNLYSCISDKPGKLISFFNNDGTILDSLDIEDKVVLYEPSKVSLESRIYMASYFYAINDIKNRIAIIYTRSDVIAILDMDGNVLKRVNGPGKTDQIPSYSGQDQIITTTFIKSDSDFIYCLYKNKLPFDEKTGMIPTEANELNIYNWEGVPMAKLIFDHPVQTFIIDRVNNRVITYSPVIDKIVYYEFPFEEINKSQQK
jgi:hypothetical protein